MGHLRGWLPIIPWTTLWWKLPRFLPLWVFTAHISDPNMLTAWRTELNKIPNVCSFPPSLPNILEIRDHLFLALIKFATNANQTLSVDVRMQPSYLNDTMLVSGRPYAQNAVFFPARSSIVASLWPVCGTSSPIPWSTGPYWYDRCSGPPMVQLCHSGGISGWGGFPTPQLTLCPSRGSSNI